MVDITDRPIDSAQLAAALRTDADGAVVTFVGTVRDFNEGRRVLRMEYHAFREMALAKLQEIEAEVERRWGLSRIALVHRVGPLALGEASVAVVVAAAHRAEAFEACRYAIDTLKATVPIWKKETYEEGDGWVPGVRPDVTT